MTYHHDGFVVFCICFFFFFSSRRRHTRFDCDWSSDVCSSDLQLGEAHSLDVVGGYEYSKFTKTVAMGQGIGFVTDALKYNALDAAGTLRDSSDASESRLVSFLSRANYGYKDRFFVTGVLRYDGSSKFAAGRQWALFPGLSASWHLTQGGAGGGPFSDLRVRVGWGRQGNPGIKPYYPLATLVGGTGATYPWSDVPQAGGIPHKRGNPKLKIGRAHV